MPKLRPSTAARSADCRKWRKPWLPRTSRDRSCRGGRYRPLFRCPGGSLRLRLLKQSCCAGNWRRPMRRSAGMRLACLPTSVPCWTCAGRTLSYRRCVSRPGRARPCRSRRLSPPFRCWKSRSSRSSISRPPRGMPGWLRDRLPARSRPCWTRVPRSGSPRPSWITSRWTSSPSWNS